MNAESIERMEDDTATAANRGGSSVDSAESIESKCLGAEGGTCHDRNGHQTFSLDPTTILQMSYDLRTRIEYELAEHQRRLEDILLPACNCQQETVETANKEFQGDGEQFVSFEHGDALEYKSNSDFAENLVHLLRVTSSISTSLANKLAQLE